MKNWKTTVAGVFAALALLFSGGKFNPEKVPEAAGIIMVGLTARDAGKKEEQK